MPDIHDAADDAVARATESITEDSALDCLADLQWVISQARHLSSEHELTDHERVQLVGWALQAAQDTIELLRHGI